MTVRATVALAAALRMAGLAAAAFVRAVAMLMGRILTRRCAIVAFLAIRLRVVIMMIIVPLAIAVIAIPASASVAAAIAISVTTTVAAAVTWADEFCAGDKASAAV